MSSLQHKALGYLDPPAAPSSLHPSGRIDGPAKLQHLLSILKHRPPTRSEYAALLDYEGRERIRKIEKRLQPNIALSTPVGVDLNECYQQFTELYGTFKHWENAEDFDDSDQENPWPLVADWVLKDENDASEQHEKLRNRRKAATMQNYEGLLEKYGPMYAAAMMKELESRFLAMGGDTKRRHRRSQQRKPMLMMLLELAEEVARLEMVPQQGDRLVDFPVSRSSSAVLTPSSGRVRSSTAGSTLSSSPLHPQKLNAPFKNAEYLTTRVISDMPQEQVHYVTIELLCTASLANFREIAEIKWPTIRKFAKQHHPEIAREVILDDDIVYDEGKEGGWWDVGQYQSQQVTAINDSLDFDNLKTSNESVRHSLLTGNSVSQLEQKPEIMTTSEVQQDQSGATPDVASEATPESNSVVLDANGHNDLRRTVLDIKPKQHIENGLLYSPSVSDINSPFTPLFPVAEATKEDLVAPTLAAPSSWWYRIIKLQTSTPLSASSKITSWSTNSTSASENEFERYDKSIERGNYEIIIDWCKIITEQDWIKLKHILIQPGARHGRGKVHAHLQHDSTFARQEKVNKEQEKEAQRLGVVLSDADGVNGDSRNRVDNAVTPFNFFIGRHRKRCASQWNWESGTIWNHLQDDSLDGDNGGREVQSGLETLGNGQQEVGIQHEDEGNFGNEENIAPCENRPVGHDCSSPLMVECEGLDDMFESP